MIRKVTLLLLSTSSLLFAGTPAVAPNARAKPKNVILMIADGFGPASATMARTCSGRALTLDRILVGTMSTHSSNSTVTDSAAAATSFASGVKTYNGAIGLNAKGQIVATILEAAEKAGMATGLVSTSRITHATPAAFAAHVPNRAQETEIAAQEISQGIEVLMGGGSAFFLPEAEGGRRTDGRNLLAEAEEMGHRVVRTKQGFDEDLTTPVLALFSDSHMDFDIDRDRELQPSLAEMTRKAIDLLKHNENGFFLMVEGSRPDHANHMHDAGAHLYEVLAYDRAVAVAIEFAKKNEETLVISTSDHETGGMALGRTVGVTQADWKPEVLNRIRSSIAAMSAAVHAGGDPFAVLAKETGIGNLNEEEKQSLEQAVDAGNQAELARAISEIISRQAGIGWTTWGHTGQDVNVYAFGPGGGSFRGHRDNVFVARRLADHLELDLDALTTQLRKKN